MLAKSKLYSIEALITKVLNDSYISQDEFVLVKNILEEYDDMKEAKSLKTFKNFLIYLQTYKTMSSYCLMCKKYRKQRPKGWKNENQGKKEIQCFYQALWSAIVKKSKFITKQEAECFLSMIGKISLIDPLLI